MKVVLVVLALAVAVLGAPSKYEPIFTDYHQDHGVPLAARLKAIEEAMDFDGNRIAGGSAANLGQYPFMGGLVIALTSGQTSVCGSSLLSANRAVTAAHCWRHGNSQARQFTVVLGSTTLFSGGTRVATTQVEMHAQYNQITLHNDVAIIRMNNVAFSNVINRIALATGSNQFAGTSARAAGFGRTGDNVGIGNNQILSHVTMPVITNAECRNTFGPLTIISSTICTSGAGGRSICPGDSGGPLQAGNLLIGISSFVSASGCSRGFPAGFARVTSFASWLQARL